MKTVTTSARPSVKEVAAELAAREACDAMWRNTRVRNFRKMFGTK